MKIFVLLCSLLVLSNCSFAPLISQRSGRSVGHENWQIDASLLPSVGASATYGFSENFDAGLLVENQLGMLYSAWGKYSFINEDEGWAIAAHGGVFAGSGFGSSTGFYVGPIFSYKKDFAEFYVNIRYNHVNWSFDDVTADQRDDSVIKVAGIDDISFGYVQVDFGISFWTSKNFAITPNGKVWVFFDDNVSASSTVIPGLSFLFNL